MARNVKLPTKGTSGSTSATSHATTGRGLTQLGRRIAGKLQKADLSKINSQVGGNVTETVKLVTFNQADKDTFVSHGLGFRVDNFEVTSPDRPARFYRGNKPPNIYGIWIRSDTAGVTARVRIYGQRKG